MRLQEKEANKFIKEYWVIYMVYNETYKENNII